MLEPMPLVYANINLDADAAAQVEFAWRTDAGATRMSGDWRALLTGTDPITSDPVLLLRDTGEARDARLVLAEAAGLIIAVFPAGSVDTTGWSRSWVTYQLTAWPATEPGSAERVAEGILTVRPNRKVTL